MMSVEQTKRVQLHPDAIQRINQRTSIGVERRRAFGGSFKTVVATAASAGLVYGCEKDIPTVQGRNGNTVNLGLVTGLGAAVAGAFALAFGVASQRSWARLQEKKSGDFLKQGPSYDLRCRDFMTEQERVEIVREFSGGSYEEAKALLLTFEAQELQREALRKAKEAEGARIRAQYHADRRKPFYSPEKKEDSASTHELD